MTNYLFLSLTHSVLNIKNDRIFGRKSILYQPSCRTVFDHVIFISERKFDFERQILEKGSIALFQRISSKGVKSLPKLLEVTHVKQE